jgi:molecular chaperone GrpE
MDFLAMTEDRENEEQRSKDQPGDEAGILDEEIAGPAGEILAGDENDATSAALTAENKKLKDQFLRLAAEFDNYRKRSERDMQNYIAHANAELMTKLLPALDDLDRIIDAAVSGAEPSALLEGIILLRKNMLKAFQDGGLEQMQALGQEFDPTLHDALLHVEIAGEVPNKIVEVHKKGYLFKERVLRHAQVIVSK